MFGNKTKKERNFIALNLNHLLNELTTLVAASTKANYVCDFCYEYVIMKH